MTNHKQMY